MLDDITKRRINTARDILVGKLPDPKSQVEQITIALIYKFMDDMDRQAELLPRGKAKFFTDKFKDYSWRNVFSPQKSGYDIVNLYGEAIQNMNQNPNVPPLFRDIFKNAYLPYRDPETLKSFLKEINEFEYDHSERLGDAFEYLLSILGSQGEAGQFRTPRNIIDFMVEMLEPKKNEKILDPACGTGGFLISAYKYIIKHNSKNYDPKNDPKPFELQNIKLSEITINGKGYRGEKLTSDDRKRLVDNISGYDISPDMVRLSLVNMYLHGFSNPKIYEYDTLTRDDKWDEKAEVILANPPFMSPKGGIKPHKRFSVQSKRSEVLFVDYMAEHLTSMGRAAIIVPEGIIFQNDTAYRQLRKMLVEEYLVGVISLPAGLFNPYSGVKTSILWLDKQIVKKTKNLLFVKIENDGFDLGAQRRPIENNDLPDAYRAIMEYKKAVISEGEFKDDIWQKIKVIEKNKISKSGDYNLSGERYGLKEIHTNVKWPMVELGEVVEIESGSRQKGGAISSGIPSIGGEQINEHGDILFEKMKYITKEHFQSMKKGVLKKDDVLMVKDGATTGKTGYFNSKETAAVNEHVFILRARNNILPQYLYGIIRSEDFQNKLRPYIKGIIGGISLEVKEIKIPVPSLSAQEELVTELDSYQKIIVGARQVVENYKPRIDIDPKWPVLELGDICQFTYGYTDTALTEGDARFIRITDISEKGLLRDDDVKYIKLNNEARKYLLKKGDLLVARTGATCGKALYFNADFPAVYASYLIKLEFDKQKILPEYYWVFTLSANYDIQKRKLVTGGGQPQFNANVIKRIKIPLPEIEIQREIIEQAKKEQEVINLNENLIEIFVQETKRRIAKVWGEK